MLKAFQTFMQVDGGGLLLPEMMLVLFAMGILLTDYLLEARDKYFNALMAMLGVIFSAITLWQLRLVADRGALPSANPGSARLCVAGVARDSRPRAGRI